MRRLLPILATTIATATVASVAAADRGSLGVPRLLVQEPMIPMVVLGADFFARPHLLDMSIVQEHPLMRARRDYSLMAALPESKNAPSGPALPFLAEKRSWKVSEVVRFTFPLAITGKNLVTAEIAGTGQLAIAPTGFARGGIFTFSGAF